MVATVVCIIFLSSLVLIPFANARLDNVPLGSRAECQCLLPWLLSKKLPIFREVDLERGKDNIPNGSGPGW